MAFSQIVTNANRSGAFTSDPLTVPAGTTRVTVRMTSNNWPALPADQSTVTDRILWAIDRSDDDGSTWREITDGETLEGARAKDGTMPSVVLTASADPATGLITPWSAHLLRARCRITGTMRFGLEVEMA